jgi:hypothetical protein
MSLIHESQISQISSTKIKGVLRSEKQRFAANPGQTWFSFTLLPSSTRVIKTELEVNGVPYEENTPSFSDGAYTRSGLDFRWDFTAANGGFDMEGTMVVVIYVYYYGDDEVMPLNVESVQLSDKTPELIVGDYEADENMYFEQYDISSANIEDFLGLNVNGAFYTHPSIVSYDANTGLVTLNKMRIVDTDSVSVVANTI